MSDKHCKQCGAILHPLERAFQVASNPPSFMCFGCWNEANMRYQPNAGRSEIKNVVKCTGCGEPLKRGYYLCTIKNYPNYHNVKYCAVCFEERNAKGWIITQSYVECDEQPQPTAQTPTPTTGLQTPIEESYTAIPPLALHEMARYFLHRHRWHIYDVGKEYKSTPQDMSAEALNYLNDHIRDKCPNHVKLLIKASYYALIALEIEIVGMDNIATTGGKCIHYDHMDYCYSIIPPWALGKVACVMGSGTKKYGVRNWDKISVLDHVNHAIRHERKYFVGDTEDEPTGVDHLAHMACRALMALEVEMLKQQPNNEITDTDTVLQVLQKKANP